MSPSASAIRTAAFRAIDRLVQRNGEILSWQAISAGFEFEGRQILFANKAVGIFKPALLTDGAPLSLRTSRPSRPGREAVYEDLASGDGFFHYKFQGNDPDNHYNRMLQKAWDEKIPLIYFYGLSDATYQAIHPVSLWGLIGAGWKHLSQRQRMSRA